MKNLQKSRPFTINTVRHETLDLTLVVAVPDAVGSLADIGNEIAHKSPLFILISGLIESESHLMSANGMTISNVQKEHTPIQKILNRIDT